jgi:putative NIF3 family GTP cyclohydrolase 1 type 2
MPLDAFLERCKARLGVPALRYCATGRPVSRLAVMGGAGADSLEDAVYLGCDTYVTADVKYHQFQRAQELGLNLIDADHFYTENPIVQSLAERLAPHFPEVEFLVSARHTDCIRFA